MRKKYSLGGGGWGGVTCSLPGNVNPKNSTRNLNRRKGRRIGEIFPIREKHLYCNLLLPDIMQSLLSANDASFTNY